VTEKVVLVACHQSPEASLIVDWSGQLQNSPPQKRQETILAFTEVAVLGNVAEFDFKSGTGHRAPI
jgi:hypothetical protein